MSEARTFRTEAVVLRRTDTAEADRIVTLYSPRGKFGAVAKGSRRTTSRLAGHLEIFTRADVFLATTRNLPIITQASAIDVYAGLRADLRLISLTYRLIELLDRITTEHDPNPTAFTLLVQTLERLSAPDAPIEVVSCYFDLHLLQAFGYQPSLHRCVRCARPVQPVANAFSIMEGGVLCAECAARGADAITLGLNALKVLRFLQTRAYEQIPELRMTPATWAEVERVLRAYAAHVIERELHSTRLFDMVRQDDFLARKPTT